MPTQPQPQTQPQTQDPHTEKAINQAALNAHTTSTSTSEERAAQTLAKHKRVATGLLVAVTVVFICVVAFTDRNGIWGYVEACAEAAMVGGLADWFAVSALFQHPLSIPIPHTAIIPKRKDQIGASLGTFVQENFLKPEIVRGRLENTDLAKHGARWLKEPANNERVAEQLSVVITSALEVLNDEELQTTIETQLQKRIAKIDAGPLAANALELAIEGGHHHSVFDAGLVSIQQAIAENRPLLRSRMATESPWWVPEQIDDRIFEKIYGAINTFIDEVTADPNHEIRATMDNKIEEYVQRLRDPEDLGVKANMMKQDFVQHAAVRDWTSNLWANLKRSIIKAAENPESELRSKLVDSVAQFALKLEEDKALASKVNSWAVAALTHVAAQSREEVADLISTTVAGWDAQDTSRRIELQVGKDLQFIRINGTVVGGLAGIVIHAIAQVIA